MKYKHINEYNDEEIMNILYYGSGSELKILPLSVGEFHSDYQFSQNVCFFLLENSDESENINEDIRANAILGLSYIARRYNKLDVAKLKILLRQQQFSSKENVERIEYALEDISLFLNEKLSINTT